MEEFCERVGVKVIVGGNQLDQPCQVGEEVTLVPVG